MAIWDEPKLEFPMERGCGMNEQEEKRGEEGKGKEKKGKERGNDKQLIATVY